MKTVSPEDVQLTSTPSGETRSVSEPAQPDVRSNGQANLKVQLHRRLISALPPEAARRPTEPELRLELVRLAEEMSHQNPDLEDVHEQAKLVEEVLNEILGYGPIAELMRDTSISEILINGPHQVFIERRGQLQATDVTFRDEVHLLEVVTRMIASAGRKIHRKSPMVDARLPDGSRMNAVLNPPALNGPLVSIRRFGVRPLTAEDLLANESITKEMLDFLAACVKARMSIVVSGGSGSGKTTLLNALSRFIPSSERLVTVEDTAELELQLPHVAKMEAIPGDASGEGEVTIADLVRNALRMRPDRIIVGECRGAEALDMLQAMNTGHEGSMTTIHANSSRDALNRVELMIGLAGVEMPVWAIRKLLASSVNLVVQVSRLSGGRRKVVAISEVTGIEGDIVSMHDLFQFVQTGLDKNMEAEGYFRATGIRPNFLNKLSARGAALSPEQFAERRLQPRKDRETGR